MPFRELAARVKPIHISAGQGDPSGRISINEGWR
jgi:hypothetical protein